MATKMAETPRFTAWPTTSVNTGVELYLTVALGNVGTAAANDMQIDDISLENQSRISPNYFPLPVGFLDKQNNAAVSARFSASGLNVGDKHLLTIRGTYIDGGVTLGFAVNRFVEISAVTEYPIPLLAAHAEVGVGSGSWAYTLFNDEAPGSDLKVAAFSLDIRSNSVVTGTPQGWQAETDGASYVLWFTENESDQIPAGQSLTGFEIQSSSVLSTGASYVINSWDSSTDTAGPVRPDVIFSPGNSA